MIISTIKIAFDIDIAIYVLTEFKVTMIDTTDRSLLRDSNAIK